MGEQAARQWFILIHENESETCSAVVATDAPHAS
jgi:hypothetical protein